MISYFKGTLKEKHPPTLIVETGAIGYLIEASMQTFYQLPEVGENVVLHIHLLIKEEKPVLYGFIHAEERKLFQELIKINTIGPKVALTILSTMDINQLLQVVTERNVEALYYIPGIGRKTAERLLLELTNRLAAWKPLLSIDATVQSYANAQPLSYAVQQDATSALIALGYKPQVATQSIRAILNASKDSDLSLEQLIRLSLHHLKKTD